MKLHYRFGLIAVVLGAAWYGERRLESHVNARPPEMSVSPPALAALPNSLGAWRGEDERLGSAPLASHSGISGTHLQRNYFQAHSGQVATIYLRYTPLGTAPTFTADDLDAAGAEPASAESAEPLRDDSANHESSEPSGRRGRWAFRRHFSLPIADDPRCDALQNMARRARTQAPTVTLEVFVPENFPTDPQAADEFVRLADSAVASLVAAETENVVRVPLLSALFSK